MRARHLLSLLFFVGASFAAPLSAEGQTYDYARECISNIDNATVHIPADANISLPDDTPIEPGDTLAVYTEQETCAGYGVWEEGKGATFAAAGSDSVEVSDDGYSEGESLRVEVFDVSAGTATDVGEGAVFTPCDSVDMPICGEGEYEDGTFQEVAGLQPDSALVTRSLTLSDGWNFVSVPVQSDLAFETLFPECSSGFLYTAGEGYTTIGAEESLPAGKGAAVQCQADTTSVTGPLPSPTIEVGEGWTLIGSVEDTVAVDAVTTTPAGILASEFFRLPPEEGYEPVEELHPGEGYWVKTAEAGTLDVSGEPAPLASTPTTMMDGIENATRLVLVDATGRQSELWLKEGLAQEQRSRLELPPVPPGDVFDVRFADGYVAASLSEEGETELSGKEHRIQLQGADFPVKIRLETDREDRRFDLSTGEKEVALSKDRSSAQIQQSTKQLAVAAAPLPGEFKLGKASPNPLRSQANVQYALPKTAEVTISVYDVLGRRIARLVDGERQTGVHQAQVDASRLSSGKYFVRMQAESFQETRQLTVVQ